MRILVAVLLLLASCTPAPATLGPDSQPPLTAMPPTATPDAGRTLAPSPSAAGCDTGQLLSVSPIADTKLVSITPLGNLDPPGHVFPTDHIYLNVPGRDQRHEVVAVVAPGFVEVSRITSQQQFGADPFTDYKIEFTICGTLSGHFAHLGAVSERLRAAFDGVNPECRERTVANVMIRSCAADVRLRLTPREPVGETNPRATGLDFGVFDSSRRLGFVNAERYRTNLNTLGAICPLDRFVPEIRTALSARLGSGDLQPTLRTVEPVCGEVMQDRPATAQGNWFQSGRQAYPEDPHFAFVHDNVDPTRGVMSIGSGIPGIAAGAYRYGAPAGERVNRDPAEITDTGSVWCFDGLRARQATPGRILLSLSSTVLRIEYDRQRTCAATPWQIGAGTQFDR